MTSKLANIETLAVRAPNWVGDVVMATPVFECLRQNLPAAHIIGVLRKDTQGIVKDSPWFDELVDGDDKSWAGFQRMRRQIRARAPQAAILLTYSFRSALTMRLSGVRRIYGYRRQGRSLLLTGGPTAARQGRITIPSPMTECYLGLCRWLGLTLPERSRPTLYIGEELSRRGELLLKKHGVGPGDFLVGLTPGAKFGSSKCWPAEYFGELAEMCQEKLKAKILLFYGPGEEDIARAIRQQTRADLMDVHDDGLDLEILKPLVKRCNLLITNDTGPRHYAVAFEVPVVVLMGPTDPRYTNANLERTIVMRKELDCSPCHKRVCPRQHECMREIRPADVFAAAERLVSAHRQDGAPT
jgi:heptosyltransferase-2